MASEDLHRRWADRSGEFSPTYYAYYGANKTSALLEALLEEQINHEDSVLELGCSSGRHLAHLLEAGFDDIAGVDVNDEAFEVMAAEFPTLEEQGTFYHDTIENVVDSLEEDAFDAVYSVETLQHIHPDAAWVFDELARITEKVLITVEVEDNPAHDESVNYVDEGLPLYYRNWKQIFSDRGFTQVEVEHIKRETIRVFRPSDSHTEPE